MSIKIAVVGGGSTYTPELVEGFAARGSRMAVDELVLLDVDRERREVVGGLAQRMLDAMDWTGRLVVTDDLDAAVDGADFVLIQLRVGGQAARRVDETLPLRFESIGQETTGAGGFAKALRTVPVVLDIAERVGRRASPEAWIVDFTNPVGIVTQALLDHGHRAIGLCNVAIGLQRRFAAKLSVDPARVSLDHVGLNHLSWEREVRVDGVDRLPELIESEAAWIGEMMGFSADLIRTLGAVPSYYLRYYYAFDEVLSEQREGHLRADEVIEIETRLLEMYRDPSLHTKPDLLATRGGAFYSEAAAELVASLHDGRGDIQVVDVRNDGAMPGLPDDAVVEVPAVIDRAGAHPLPTGPLEPAMLGLVQHMKAYERLTIEAALAGDRDKARVALLANPLVGQWGAATSLVDAIIDVNRALLPRFNRP